MLINTSCSLFVVRHELVNRIIVSSDIWSDMVIYPAISLYHFLINSPGRYLFRELCLRWHSVHHLLLQWESAIMSETCRTSRLLATEQPWPQLISLQNLGQGVYHEKHRMWMIWDGICLMRELECNRTLLTMAMISGTDVPMPAFTLQDDSFHIHRDIN